jgi:hypothetical protein
MTRLERWVAASHRAGRFAPSMLMQVQGLGMLDISLSEKDRRFLNLPHDQQASIDQSLELSERLTISHLWVLGAFELIRTISQRLRENPSSTPFETTQSWNALKKRFARLRVPLAKMEAAGGHESTDSPIAYQSISLDHGIAWQLSENHFITRQELANDMLCNLETLRTD